jgi:hypothetical protein
VAQHQGDQSTGYAANGDPLCRGQSANGPGIGPEELDEKTGMVQNPGKLD